MEEDRRNGGEVKDERVRAESSDDRRRTTRRETRRGGEQSAAVAWTVCYRCRGARARTRGKG